MIKPTKSTHSKKRLTSHSPPPQPPVSIPRQASLLNATQTILAGARGVGQDVLQYAPPLKEGVETQVKATAAQLAGVQFNPATADWSKIYTAVPQGNAVNNLNVAGKGVMKCLSNYAICAFANCTISFASTPPVAECGCLPLVAGQNSPRRPNGFPSGDPFNIMSVNVILDRKLKEASRAACSTDGACSPPLSGNSVSGFVTGSQFNTAPFCEEMQPSASSGGKPTMYGGVFDLISTFSPTAWLPGDTAGGNQGSPGQGAKCDQGGAFAYCATAACLNRPSFNGLPTTCYCPVYTPPPGVNFTVAGAGATCSGESVGGKLTFVQNGAFQSSLN